MSNPLRIPVERLLERIAVLGKVGALPGGGVCRLALSEEDRLGRDLVREWMRGLGLAVQVDRIGNIIGLRRGQCDIPPVMIGSHIDSVRTGGLYDGALGVLAGLEVIAVLNDAGAETEHPLAVAVFTNEEGARFAPDMMGSLLYAGGMDLDAALATRGIDGATVGESLARIGYAGDRPCGAIRPHVYLELHIEQGPVLEARGIEIGVVEGVQGISWTEITFEGRSAHAGTTPMALRRDAGRAATELATEVGRLADEIGAGQVSTVGALSLHPNLVNVVPERAVMTVDLRNPDETQLRLAETRLIELTDAAARRNGTKVTSRSLSRFEPVAFDPTVKDRIEAQGRNLGYSMLRLHAGAGHDAQMLARLCPAGMIFIPSHDGLSHNIAEFSSPEDIERGTTLLLATALDFAGLRESATGDMPKKAL